VVTITVIRTGDLADRILDRTKNPQWNGERMRLLNSLPNDMELWGQYAELRRNGGDQGKAANEFYVKNQAAMDAGAEASWEALFNADEKTAIQHGMNLRIDDPEMFASEYQNQPENPEDNPDRPTLEGFTNSLNRTKRGTLIAEATHLVFMIDVQEKCLYWTAVSASDDFTAAVVDYGTFPPQPGHYFALRDVQNTLTKHLAAAGKGGGIEAAIFYGLECLTDELFTRTWTRADGTEIKPERGLIDSGDQTKTVYKFCRESKWGALLLPSKGAGITAGKAPIDKWKLQDREKRGDNYVITSDAANRAVRLVRFDTNYWKTFVCRRAAVAGGKGSLTVWGDDPRAHRMLQDHCNAETCVKTIAADGRTVWEWSIKPGGGDNHYLDTLVGAYVALATVGCALKETITKETRKQPRVSYL
ncbi:MAG: phage terminase large subunit family protein, partial [Patescibacteria group bacterium]|nr:phage terminase large subunit family protein [Patescibacteria group bacterium]